MRSNAAVMLVNTFMASLAFYAIVGAVLLFRHLRP